MRDFLLPSEGYTETIVLTGDIEKAFSDVEAVLSQPYRIYGNILDAIDAAANTNVSAVIVIISGVTAGLKGALKALREVNSQAKIILLAQTYEEPSAIQLVKSTFNGMALADDYLICPMDFSQLLSYVSGLGTAGVDDVSSTTIEATSVDKSLALKLKTLEKLATTDELTGLKNRRYIREFCKQVIERSNRENGRVTLLIFDIDNFKHYNDVYGHSAGDEVLRQAGLLMQRCCRRHDVIARVGGDEFVVVFWDDPQLETISSAGERRSALTDHPKEVIFIAKRFRKELKKTEFHLLGPEGKGVLTISGGLAGYPQDGSTVEELFEQADKALLEAKSRGKNRIYLVGEPEGDIADIE
ncbi:MAG TPA: GGDEF domain-containing protein [Sedimentisphaerales bacterium]|nr:GGDEF domain-containing protein [Sedimentisphaerales bacterium]